jgi:DNA-binding response OmpR family regulator
MSTKRVLLCDDEIHILRAAEFKVARAGFEVRLASNGLEALEEIERFDPHILVTDCQMPRLDGLGLCRRLRENPQSRDLPVLMLTAKGFELSHEELREQYGIIAVLAKPFSPRELLQRIQQILETTPARTVCTA